MDEVSRVIYELRFENAFLKKRGSEFQDFFSEIMEKRHHGDFFRVKPWGNVGDKKNDGYLKSERILFQVYAPNELQAKEAIQKIDEDFNGALPHWTNYFDKWQFVHNARDGLGPDVVKKLLDLDQSHANISISPFGYEELRYKFFELHVNDIKSFMGAVPTKESLNHVKFDHFKELLTHIVLSRNTTTVDLRPVPANKLKINNFSEYIESLLRIGFSKTGLVRDFFAKWPDATFGDLVTHEINDEYKRLRDTGLSADRIFIELRSYVLGDRKLTPEMEMAALVTLSYFFEECDIFEREGSEQ